MYDVYFASLLDQCTCIIYIYITKVIFDNVLITLIYLFTFIDLYMYKL